MILSIDPGLKGGAVFIKDGGIHSYVLFERGYKNLYDLLRANKVETVIIENVRGYRGENVKSIFTFGKTVGHVEGVLICTGFDLKKIIRIEPKTWVSFYKDVWECKGKQKSCKAVKKLFQKKGGFDDIIKYDALSDAYLMWFFWEKTRTLNKS